MVLPIGDRDQIACFADQVKLTRALVWDLHEATDEVKLLIVTLVLGPNQMLIVCVPRNQVYTHTV
jgi:hypothetical protein